MLAAYSPAAVALLLALGGGGQQASAFVAPLPSASVARGSGSAARPLAHRTQHRQKIGSSPSSAPYFVLNSSRRGDSSDFEDDDFSAAKVAPGGINVSGEAPFEIRGFSLASAFLITGVGITVASFTEYFTTGGSGGLSGLGFVYGIPVSLIGLALRYAELPPVGVEGTPEAEAVFEAKANETMRKIKQDVTRHRYGDDAHLDTTVKALGLVMPQSDYPQLKYLKQEISPEGECEFSMVFQSLETPYKVWVEPERIKKYTTFFGPGVWATVDKINAKERLVAIKLTTGTPPQEPEVAAEESKVEAA
jgi:hypothetical protein